MMPGAETPGLQAERRATAAVALVAYGPITMGARTCGAGHQWFGIDGKAWQKHESFAGGRPWQPHCAETKELLTIEVSRFDAASVAAALVGNDAPWGAIRG